MKTILLILSLFFVASHAEAKGGSSSMNRTGLEIRGSYGIWPTATDLNNTYTTNIPGWPTQPQPQVMGGDLLYQPQKLPMVIGVRYETFSATSDTAAGPLHDGATNLTNVSTKFAASRASVLLGFRQDFASGFFGILGSVGVSQKADYTINFTTAGQSVSNDCTGSLATSYSAGVEAGFRTGVFEFGAEAGYLSFKVNSFKDPQGNTLQDAANNDIMATMSGLYAKGFLGLAF